MFLLLCGWLSMLLLGTTPPSPAAALTADSAAVATVVNAYRSALATGDTAAALQLLARDAVILEIGDVETREEYRTQHLAADIAFAQSVASTRRPTTIVLHGDVAWSIATSRSQGTFRGRAVNSQGAELIVLSREPEGWRIRAIHWSSRSLNPAR